MGTLLVESHDKSRSECNALCMLVHGNGNRIMRNVAAQNGFDAWRQLSVRYNSYTKGRAITMLTEVLRWEFGA